MASLTPLEYGSVVWKGVALVGDTLDDVDEDPDMSLLEGTVTLKASPNAILVPTATPPATGLPIPIVGDVVAGILSRNGQPRVKVVATDTEVTNPTGFTYTATFDIMYDGTRVNYGPIVGIEVPSGSTVDLTLVAPTPSNGASPLLPSSYYLDPDDENVLIVNI